MLIWQKYFLTPYTGFCLNDGVFCCIYFQFNIFILLIFDPSVCTNDVLSRMLFPAPISSKLFLTSFFSHQVQYFLLPYQSQVFLSIRFYVEVFDQFWSWFLCMVISMDLFRLFYTQSNKFEQHQLLKMLSFYPVCISGFFNKIMFPWISEFMS